MLHGWRGRRCPWSQGRLRIDRASLGIAFVLLAGCAHQAPVATSERPPVNLSGYSPAFREGFGDGCDTARGSRKRKEARYADDAQYRRGWDDGQAICTRK